MLFSAELQKSQVSVFMLVTSEKLFIVKDKLNTLHHTIDILLLFGLQVDVCSLVISKDCLRILNPRYFDCGFKTRNYFLKKVPGGNMGWLKPLIRF